MHLDDNGAVQVGIIEDSASGTGGKEVVLLIRGRGVGIVDPFR